MKSNVMTKETFCGWPNQETFDAHMRVNGDERYYKCIHRVICRGLRNRDSQHALVRRATKLLIYLLGKSTRVRYATMAHEWVWNVRKDLREGRDTGEFDDVVDIFYRKNGRVKQMSYLEQIKELVESGRGRRDKAGELFRLITYQELEEVGEKINKYYLLDSMTPRDLRRIPKLRALLREEARLSGILTDLEIDLYRKEQKEYRDMLMKTESEKSYDTQPKPEKIGE